ncbi:MAG: cold shock domain-containing protein [Actinobacteria bacterium]|nr:cold shock domain-containing protein [Actinomycetota bacterium]
MAREGMVKWFNREEGYGCITPDEGGEDLFFSYSAIENGFGNLEQGERVAYEVIEGWRGPEAENISKISTSEKSARKEA